MIHLQYQIKKYLKKGVIEMIAFKRVSLNTLVFDIIERDGRLHTYCLVSEEQKQEVLLFAMNEIRNSYKNCEKCEVEFIESNIEYEISTKSGILEKDIEIMFDDLHSCDYTIVL